MSWGFRGCWRRRLWPRWSEGGCATANEAVFENVAFGGFYVAPVGDADTIGPFSDGFVLCKVPGHVRQRRGKFLCVCGRQRGREAFESDETVRQCRVT